jgi:hypothetical protein
MPPGVQTESTVMLMSLPVRVVKMYEIDGLAPHLSTSMLKCNAAGLLWATRGSS